MLTFIAMVSVWTPFLHPKVLERWFTWPNMAFLAPVPIVTAGIAYAFWRSLTRGGELIPFIAAMRTLRDVLPGTGDQRVSLHHPVVE